MKARSSKIARIAGVPNMSRSNSESNTDVAIPCSSQSGRPGTIRFERIEAPRIEPFFARIAAGRPRQEAAMLTVVAPHPSSSAQDPSAPASLGAIASVAEIVAELAAGRMVILVDEEDRENEGDLVLAADFVTPEAINFMARFGRGLICLTLTEERCRQLNLPLMTAANGTRYGTKFTMSIEAAEGVTTGISAADRARTIAGGGREGRASRPTSCSRATSSRSGPKPAAC